MMAKITPEQWQKIKQTLADALELPEHEQSALIEARCDADAVVAGWARLLLAHKDESDLAFPLTSPDFGPLAGTDIGRYRLQWRIGRGGFGEVYLATLRDPIAWRVAVKVLRPEYSGEAFRQRLQREMRVLSGFHHPGIVRMLDAGITDNGQWYFAMEFVDGQPLNSFCSSRQLSVRDRLELFLNLCDAVQYAHNRCVIHCDLKPYNILVSDDGNVTLLDFGIARLLYPEVMDNVDSLSHPLAEPVTLGYGSPEQFEGHRVTTATDVYSLGAILYELLAGCLPFSTQGVSVNRYAERLCSEDPPAPSKAAEAKSISYARKLRGDLDSIVLKALHRDPELRYATAAQMADDVKRHLSNLPIHAHRDSWRYRGLKFLTRHAVESLACLLVFASMAAGLSISVAQRNRARAEQQKADSRLDEIGRMATLFHSALQHVESEGPDNVQLLRSVASDFELLGDALQKSDDLADAQRAYEKSASLYERVGYPQSSRAVERKLARLQTQHRPFGFAGVPHSREHHASAEANARTCALADAYWQLGNILDLTKNEAEARQLRERSTILSRQVATAGISCDSKMAGTFDH